MRRLFSEIAPRYDLLNHLLSLNIDRSWRRRAVGRLEWQRRPAATFLDACAGTFDLSIELASRPGFRGTVVASDFAQPMLAEGLRKLDGLPVSPVCGDTLRLPFPDDTFEGAMVAFGVRNLSSVDEGLVELHRVLRPEGRLVILDFALPRHPLLRSLYLLYFTRVLPLVGRVVSGHSWAYAYLPESVKEFPPPQDLAGRMKAIGFGLNTFERLTGGIVAIHVGVKTSNRGD